MTTVVMITTSISNRTVMQPGCRWPEAHKLGPCTPSGCRGARAALDVFFVFFAIGGCGVIVLSALLQGGGLLATAHV